MSGPRNKYTSFTDTEVLDLVITQQQEHLACTDVKSILFCDRKLYREMLRLVDQVLIPEKIWILNVDVKKCTSLLMHFDHSKIRHLTIIFEDISSQEGWSISEALLNRMVNLEVIGVKVKRTWFCKGLNWQNAAPLAFKRLHQMLRHAVAPQFLNFDLAGAGPDGEGDIKSLIPAHILPNLKGLAWKSPGSMLAASEFQEMTSLKCLIIHVNHHTSIPFLPSLTCLIIKEVQMEDQFEFRGQLPVLKTLEILMERWHDDSHLGIQSLLDDSAFSKLRDLVMESPVPADMHVRMEFDFTNMKALRSIQAMRYHIDLFLIPKSVVKVSLIQCRIKCSTQQRPSFDHPVSVHIDEDSTISCSAAVFLKCPSITLSDPF
jgi:hypothetical protein